MLIKRIDSNDRRYLRTLPHDTQGQIHGLFVVRRYTGESEIQRVWRLREALSILGRHQLYHVVENEFACEYKERNWNGLDVTVRLRIRICPAERGFARWLLMEDTGAWNNTRTIIYAPALEAVIQTDDQYGLASYVRTCLKQANHNLLMDHGVESWPSSVSPKLRVPWLEVVGVEDVKCLPHTATVKVVDVRPGTILRGQYKLIRRLGQGGMGQVWKAEHIHLQKDFAIKILSETADEKLAATIKSEAVVLSDLNNPNIVTMRGYDEDGNVSFMVMDFVEGSSLENILQSRTHVRGRDVTRGKLSEKEVAEWLMPIASAIDYMHTNGKLPIVHRDIKPANIMIGRLASDSEEVKRPFLCDFGIANRRSSVTNNAWGTEYYRAPEVRPGAEVTPKADVYSFAVTAYVCLTGDFPPRWTTDSFNTPLLRAISQGLSNSPDSRPAKCVELLNPSSIILPSEPRPQPPPKGEVVLSWEIVRNYQSMLRECGMFDAWHRIEQKHVVSRNRRTNVWRILSVSEFLGFLASMPAFTALVRTKNKARIWRHNLECWFTIRGWNDRSGRDALKSKYDAATLAVLDAIYDSITKTNEEEWT